MKNFSIKITFWLLVVDFIAILMGMFVPGVRTKLSQFAGPVIVFSELAIFLLLGTILIILTFKRKVEGRLKKFLLVTGISAVGFVVCVLLHNLISGLLSTIFNKDIEEPVFFLLAVFGCPLGFLVGAIGSIVLFFRQRNNF